MQRMMALRLTKRRATVAVLIAILVFVSAAVVIGLFDFLGVTNATVEISSLPNHAWDAASESSPEIPTTSSVVGRMVASLILFFLKGVNWAL